MTKKKQNEIKVFGYHKSTISLFKSGRREVSWPLAEKLCETFPGKSIKEWKNATPEELKRAFSQLEIELKESA